MQWRSTGKREIEIDWLKKQFQIEQLYPEMCDLKKRVIDPAIKDINTHSNYEVSWTQRKTGRRVTHLTFTFEEKKPVVELPVKPKRVKKVKEETVQGISKAEIEKQARPGESYEQAALRINKDIVNKAKSKLSKGK
jgi:plasmid replication initiation protein